MLEAPIMKKVAPTYPSRKLEQFVVRLPDGMRQQLAKLAKRNNRSMNAEIVSILHSGLARSGVKVASTEPVDPFEIAMNAFDQIIDAAITARGQLSEK